MERPDIPWLEIAAVAMRRAKLILAVVGCGVVVAASYAWIRTPTYVSTAKLIVTPERARIRISPDANDGTTMDRIREEDLNSEVELLTSVSLVRDVLAEYRDRVEDQERGLAGTMVHSLTAPLRFPSWVYQTLHGIEPLSPFDRWVKGTAARITVKPISKTELIEVSYEHEDPQWAAEFLNKLIYHHAERSAEHNLKTNARRFFEVQRQLLSDKLRNAEGMLREFYRREGLEPLPENAVEGTLGQLAELETALENARTGLAEATARADFLARELQGFAQNRPPRPGVAQSEGTRLIRGRIVALELERSKLLSSYAPTSIKIGDVDRQIEEARRLLKVEMATALPSDEAVSPAYQALEVDLAQTRVEVVSLEARVDALASQIDSHRRAVRHRERVASDQLALEQEVATAKTAFLTYLKKEEEARFSNALDESRILNVSVIEQAEPAVAPRPSNASTLILFGAVASFLLAIGLAFLLDRLDPTVKSAAEARQITDLPILSEIPS